MKFVKNMFFAASIMSMFALFSSCPSPSGGSSVKNNNAIIIFTNDIECALLNSDTTEKVKTQSADEERIVKSIGYAKIKALKDYARKSTGSQVVLVDSGNFIYGSGNENILGQYSNGDEIIKIMNKTGYDIVCVGEKDTNYGADYLRRYMSKANFSFVCSNIKRKEGQKSKLLSSLVTDYVVKDFGTTKVAFIGLTSPSTANAGYLENWEVKSSLNDMKELLQQKIDNFRNKFSNFDGLKFVVLLTNVGADANAGEDSNVKYLIKNTSGLDIVIDGGSRNGESVDRLEPCIRDKNNNPVYYGHCGRYGEKVGIFKITMTKNSDLSEQAKISLEYKTDEDNVLLEDASLNKYINDENDLISGKLSEKIGKFGGDIRLSRYGMPSDADSAPAETDWSSYKNSLNVESFAGSFVADAFRKKTGARIAVVTAGTLGKRSISNSEITVGDCYKFLDHSNAIGYVEVTGPELKEVFENSVKYLTKDKMLSYTINDLGNPKPNVSNEDFNGFLQVSGAIIEIDVSKPAYVKGENDGRIKSIKVLKVGQNNDNPENSSIYENIDLNNTTKTYSLASTSYILSGQKEGYNMFEGMEVTYPDGANGDITEAEALIDYITSLGTVNSASVKSGRIVRVNGNSNDGNE